MTDDILGVNIGMFTSGTPRSSVGRWVDGVNVRFYEGLPETSGGSVPLNEVDTFAGICRALLPFQTLIGNDYVAISTNERFYISDASEIINVTPIRESGTLGADPFTTTNGLFTVSVADAGHGLAEGDYVTFSGATAFNGVTISGDYTVTSVTNANAYVITHSVAATGMGAGGGAVVDYDYEIPVGAADSQFGVGWGIGPWGDSTHGWGTAFPGASSAVLPARVWVIVSWGEDIIAAYVGGTIYHLDSSAGISTANRMEEITNSPDTVRFILVSKNKFLIAFGAHDGSSDNPLLIRWCSREDFNDWTPTISNTAGDVLLTKGNKIVTACIVNNEILVLTDLSAYVMYDAGYPEVFAIKDDVGGACGAISPHCLVVVNGRAYWKGFTDYYVYDGTVGILRCDIRKEAFNQNRVQSVKEFAGVNSDYREIWFFRVSAGSNEIDGVDVYDYAQDVWWIGDDVRTAYHGRSEFSEKPIAAGLDGYLHQHETGSDNGSLPRTKRLRSYDAQPDAGENVVFFRNSIPDFSYIEGEVNLTVRVRRRPQNAVREKGPFTLTSETITRSIRIRGGQTSVELESTGLGDGWRMAPMGIDTTLNGKR